MSFMKLVCYQGGLSLDLLSGWCCVRVVSPYTFSEGGLSVDLS